MTNRDSIEPPADHPAPPRLHGRQKGFGGMTEDQRIALYLPTPECTPGLEEMKENDPDSYAMVIYSWA